MVRHRQHRYTVLFDAVLRTQKGKLIPYFDEGRYEAQNLPRDGKKMWFHDHHGFLREYVLRRVDYTAPVYIAEPTGKSKYKDKAVM